MRLHVGAAMAVKGGRSAVIAAEVREGREAGSGRLVHEFTVGQIERVSPYTVEACAERVRKMMEAVKDLRPCVVVDVGSPQGMALRQSLRGSYDASLHKPHAYPGVGQRQALFSSFLQGYSAGRVRFEPGLKHRADLDRALVFYMGQGVKKDGVELDSEDEALVIALGLAMFWPSHGASARALEPRV